MLHTQKGECLALPAGNLGKEANPSFIGRLGRRPSPVHRSKTMPPMMEVVINSSTSPSTGYTPFYLMYGFEPVTPMSLIQDVDMTQIERVNVFVHHMKKTFPMAMQ